jgi:hypothetical protein
MARKEIAAYVWGDGGAVTELQGKSRCSAPGLGDEMDQPDQYAEDAIAKQADAIRKSQRPSSARSS